MRDQVFRAQSPALELVEAIARKFETTPQEIAHIMKHTENITPSIED